MKRKICYIMIVASLLFITTSLIFSSHLFAADSPFDIERREYIAAIARHRMNGEWAKALEYFDKLAALKEPLSANFTFYRGETEYYLKRYGDAQRDLTAYIGKYGARALKYSEAWGILLKIAGVYAGEGRREEARSIITGYIDEAGEGGSHYDEATALLRELKKEEGEAEAARERESEAAIEDAARTERELKAIIKQIRDNMILVEGGCFQMGKSTVDSGSGYEKQSHDTCLDTYYIGKYEVTYQEWSAVMGSNPSYFKGCNTCPVGGVSWNETQKFIAELNNLTGLNYRLPTEAEWEYAAKSTGKTDNLSATNSEVEQSAPPWEARNSYRRTYPVGQKRPNSLGLYDMNGNAWEWVEDWHGDYYIMNVSRRNPRGPATGVKKVLRGGSWDFVPRGSRADSRYTFTPDGRYGSFGLRLSLSAQE